MPRKRRHHNPASPRSRRLLVPSPSPHRSRSPDTPAWQQNGRLASKDRCDDHRLRKCSRAEFRLAGPTRPSSAFVVIGVAKTKVDSVPLIIELRLSSTHLVDESGNAIHFFLVLCDDSFDTFAQIEHPRVGVLVDEINNLTQN